MFPDDYFNNFKFKCSLIILVDRLLIMKKIAQN